MDRVKMIRLRSRSAKTIHVNADTNIQDVIDLLEIPPPRMTIILNGGTSTLDKTLQQKLTVLLQDGLARIVCEENITVITGATDAGIFSIFGQGLEKWRGEPVCIGVAVKNLVTWPGRAPKWIPAFNKNRVALESHHSHFVFVDGQDWGDETEIMYALMETLSRNCSSLGVFVGGGGITLNEMEANVAQNRQMILISGSGRTTDTVVKGHSGEGLLDGRFMRIVAKGKIFIFSIDKKADDLYHLIHQLLIQD